MKAEDILPDDRNQVERDGVTIRKGSVGAFLVNARVWCDTAASEERKQEAGRDIRELLPALRALGLFEVFAVRQPELQRLIDEA